MGPGPHIGYQGTIGYVLQTRMNTTLSDLWKQENVHNEGWNESRIVRFRLEGKKSPINGSLLDPNFPPGEWRDYEECKDNTLEEIGMDPLTQEIRFTD
jgi:hypothetical protein